MKKILFMVGNGTPPDPLDPPAKMTILSVEDVIPVYATTTSSLGMVENDEAESLNNANKLIAGINTTPDGITVDGVYFIETPATALTATDIRLSSVNSGELKSNNIYTLLFTSLNIKNIDVQNVTFSNVFGSTGDLRLFYNNSENEDVIGDLIFKNNTFNGHIYIYRKRTSDTFNPANYGIDLFTFTNNNINNNGKLLVYIRNLPIAVCNIVGNTLRNCDCGLEIAIGNGSTYENEMYYTRPLITVTDNDFRNDVSWESNDATSTYKSFVVIECDHFVYLRNHVEGIWSTTVGQAIYDAYLSCNTIEYKNNVNKNNILFVDDDYLNTLMKCKGGAFNFGNVVRNYEDNDFIVEESWIDQVVASHGVDKSFGYVNYAEMGGNSDSASIYIKNNTFDIYDLRSRVSHIKPTIHETSGNIFSGKYSNNIFTETINMVDSHAITSLIFSDNVFNILNYSPIATPTSPISMLRVMDYRSANTDKIGSVIFNNNTGNVPGYQGLGKFDTELLEINNNTLSFLFSGITTSYFIMTSRAIESNISNNDISYPNNYYYIGNLEYSAEGTPIENLIFNGIHGSNAYGTTMLLKTGLPSAPTKTIRRTYDVDDGINIFYFEFTLSWNVGGYWEVTFVNSSDVEVTYRLNNQDGITDGATTFLKVYDTVGTTTAEIRFRNYDGSDNTGFEQKLGSSDMKLKVTTVNI